MQRVWIVLALVVPLPAYSSPSCVPATKASSLEEIVTRVEAEQIKYVFVGEHHRVGPVKKLAVDLSNALVEKGHEVGLYVEGFRTDCPPRDASCWSLARTFNSEAFSVLLDESKASIHAIDPPHRDRRAERMAATIAAGREVVRVVLVGRSHVIHAGDPEAEHWVYGGRLRFPNPGDLAEAFPRQEVLTIGLETSHEAFSDDSFFDYSLRHSGCGVDYVVTTPPIPEYWGTSLDSARAARQDPPATAAMR